tara:strand:+ start:9366 stop:9536 length:171 start_codon:yes stop_codon:yes gene_type:complete
MKGPHMPFHRFAILILAVISAAAVTVWLFALGGPGIMIAALPVVLIAALAVRILRK